MNLLFTNFIIKNHLILFFLLLCSFLQAQSNGKIIKTEHLRDLESQYAAIENTDRFKVEMKRFADIENGILVYKLQDGIKQGDFTIISIKDNGVEGFINGQLKEVQNETALLNAYTVVEEGNYFYQDTDNFGHNAIWLIMIKYSGIIKTCYFSIGYPIFVDVVNKIKLPEIRDCYNLIIRFYYQSTKI